MKRLLKLALPFLIIAEIILINLDFLDLNTTIIITGIFELLFILVAVKQIFSSRKVFEANKSKGHDKWTSIENSAEIFMPYALARLLTFELKIWYYLGAWVFRRIKHDENMFTYHRKSIFGAFVLLLLFITPAEIAIMGIFLPLVWLKLLLAILSVYAFMWLLGIWVSMKALPHNLGKNGLFLHIGILSRGYIPYSAIEKVATEKTENLGIDGLSIDKEKNAAYFFVAGTTDIWLILREPVVLERWISLTTSVKFIHLAVDDPSRFVTELEKRLY
jgi:hypothetical protein